MRISKVNVEVNGKDTMVRMYRSSEKGALIYADIDQIDRTTEIIPEKKRNSFNLSIANKTLIRYESIEKKDRPKYKIVEDIIKRRKLPDTIEIEEIAPFLNHKFLQPVKYWKGDQLVSFNLSDCILRAVKQHDTRELKPYDDWRKWYTEDKSEKLKKSIVNNRIPLTDEQSKRQKALVQWEPCFVGSGHLDLEAYHQTFRTDALAAALGSVAKGELRDNGTPKGTNEYHRNLKRTLQAHQALIFGKRETPNIANRADDRLAIYNLEIVKYMERYFPIKKSGRRNTADDIAYYLKADTIKRTISHQLENAVRANLLRKGKYEHHELDETTTSETLSNLKRDEAFVMNLITTSAFAANNIRNIVDPQQPKDILGKGDFKTSLAAERFNSHVFRLFFNVEDKVVDAITLWALRGAVQKIRNNVAHYKKLAIETIFNVTGFEYPDSPDIAYSTTIYKQLFEKELEKLPEAFALQLKSGGVLAYYDFNLLKGLLATVTFQLCRSVVPFAPGFKKVMKSGVGYQNSERDATFYDLELSGYIKKEEYLEGAWNGRYFLLKTIYNYLFLPKFTADATKFADTVAWVLKKNKQQAQNSRNTNAFAFADIRFMTKDESISGYMAYVQSQWMLEANKKGDKKKDDVRINFEKFVIQLFVKGFDSFLKQAKFKFIHYPQPQINASDTNQQQADKLNLLETTIRPFCNVHSQNIDPDKDAQIAWYVYCKLLDATHLSTLRNELIKYRSAAGSDIFAHVTEIIELCLLSADQVPTDYRQIYPDKESCLQRLIPFMANGADYVKWGDLYVQTDNETPVVHSGIELSVKYGTADLLQKLIASDEKFKIAASDFDLWHPAKPTIEPMIKQREKHHDLWREAKKKDDQERKDKVKERGNYVSKFMKTKSADYMLICDYIDRYNQIDNKLHFDHLKRLQNLIVEILGRMSGFVVLWERDFQYFDQQRVQQQGGMLLDFSHGVPKEKALKPHEAYFNQLFLCDDYRNIRNHIAHFNYLTQSAEKYSLIDLINALRALLHYDRKLKNAVSKAFIDLFDKQGMVLKLKFDSQKHHLQVESVMSKPLFHLGLKKKEEGMYTDQVSQTYCDMCKCLLEMKN
ncbi:MAG: type VI-A CRISPR-associated RNA-guided ribonuclease Cas13a [Bacteroidota bacterium]|nr:type VI-A CRISPR-associated RNA-guided ribonuclease Cas13a [Bacteroidota bacterium]